jgi:hypothetical protein
MVRISDNNSVVLIVAHVRLEHLLPMINTSGLNGLLAYSRERAFVLLSLRDGGDVAVHPLLYRLDSTSHLAQRGL